MARANNHAGKHRRSDRQTEDFPVRRWLAAGAASVGMGAALLGLSMTDAQVGTAAADTSDQSSVSSTSSAGADDAGSTGDAGESNTLDDADEGDSDDEDDSAAVDDADLAEDSEAADNDASDAKDEDDQPSASPDVDESDNSSTESASTPDTDETTPDDTVSARTPSKSTASARSADSVGVERVSVSNAAVSAPADAPSALESFEDRKQEDVAKAIAALMAAANAWIAALPVDARVKDDLTTGLLFVRNTFFNQDPTVDPVQISGQIDGPVTGAITVFDAEGDAVKLRLKRAPTNGTVQLNDDGTYTYTPGAGFTGVDTFTVLADDPGLHVNVLDAFGRAGTTSGVLVNHGALKFNFTWVGDVAWSQEAKTAVQSAANALAGYFMVTKPVTVTYEMSGNKTGFAAASSDNVSDKSGFYRTVVQNKVITGVDTNGEDYDGSISVNLTSEWSYDIAVPATRYDFRGTLMHEMLHTFGFDASMKAAGANTRTNWTVYDSFIVTADDVKPIGRRYVWNRAFDTNLTGGNGGLYFGGANAVKANNGNLVPLLTENPWNPGSSVTHLDDGTFTGANQKMMNAYTPKGLVIRVLSPIELGILKDLGFQVAVAAESPAPVLVAV